MKNNKLNLFREVKGCIRTGIRAAAWMKISKTRNRSCLVTVPNLGTQKPKIQSPEQMDVAGTEHFASVCSLQCLSLSWGMKYVL